MRDLCSQALICEEKGKHPLHREEPSTTHLPSLKNYQGRMGGLSQIKIGRMDAQGNERESQEKGSTEAGTALRDLAKDSKSSISKEYWKLQKFLAYTIRENLDLKIPNCNKTRGGEGGEVQEQPKPSPISLS